MIVTIVEHAFGPLLLYIHEYLSLFSCQKTHYNATLRDASMYIHPPILTTSRQQFCSDSDPTCELELNICNLP